MKITPFLIYTLSLFIFSCIGCIKKNDNKKDNIIYVDLEKADKVSLWDIFSHIELIPLETNEQSLIRQISKIVPYEDNYYVLDYRKSEILMFDFSGKYLHKISDKGEGPQEYSNISDFEIDEDKNILSVLAPVNYSMYEYDFNGVFLNKYKIPDIIGAYMSFISLNKDTIVYFTFDYDNRIKFFSKSENRIVKELLPENENLLNKFSYNVFPYANYLHRASSSTLFKVKDNGEIIDGYTWDFGKLNNSSSQLKKVAKIPNNELQQYFFQFINSEIINHIIIINGGNSKYLFSQIWRKGKHINILHNKMNNKNYVFEKTIENATFHPLSWHEDYVIGFYSDEWGERKETIPDAVLDNKNTKIINQWNEYDNPILIKYYFKKQ